MRVLITFKVGAEGDQVHTRHYDFEAEEFERLKADFLGSLNGALGALRGACYTCIDPDTNQTRDLLLRFDDVLYLECLDVYEDHRTITKSLNPSLATGPLHIRLANAHTNPQAMDG